MLRTICRSLSILGILVLVAVVGRAEIFTAYLTGAQEVPAVPTSATGYARIVVNESTGSLTFTVVFNNLSSNQIMAHIHAPAPIGQDAAVAINFGAINVTSGTITGTTTITPTQLAQLRQHLGYVNVHSVNNSNGEIRGQLGVERPVDFDGDGRTDMSVWRFPNADPAPVTWWNLNSTAGPGAAGPFGDAQQDFPIPGDYDGDGISDLALIRSGATVGAQSFVYIIRSSNGTADVIPFGVGGDEAVCRDYDGDGLTDLAVFRPGATIGSQAFWWIRRSTNVQGGYLVVPFGLTAENSQTGSTFERPVPGDYDGDGKFDIAVYRSGFSPTNNFIVLRSSDGTVQFQPFGNFLTDYVVPGDYDGDGKYDFAMARTGATASSPLVWWILQSSTGTTRTQTFGRSSDFPTQGDYDGDARTDLAIYRGGATASAQSFFWVNRSFDLIGYPTAWGLGADFPVNSFDAR